MTGDNNNGQGGCEIIRFGRRPVPPRACVVENRTYVRTFLADMLDELGFIAREAGTADIRMVLRDFRPDLIVLGPLSGTLEVQSFLKTLQAQVYGGTVMLFGGRSSEALIRGHEFGEQAGLTMLPPLGTPFRRRRPDRQEALEVCVEVACAKWRAERRQHRQPRLLAEFMAADQRLRTAAAQQHCGAAIDLRLQGFQE